MSGRLTPFEKEEAGKCDALIRAHGGEIVSFSQPRATKQTEGIPDRRYRCFGVAFWWEVKSQAKDAQLTADQADFLLAELNAGSLAACGTLNDLAWLLPYVRNGLPLRAARELVNRWMIKGFRRTSKKRRVV